MTITLCQTNIDYSFYEYMSIQIYEEHGAELLGTDGKFNFTNLDQDTVYQTIYDVMMKVDFKDFQPARGWPEALKTADKADCTDNLINFLKGKADSYHASEQWEREDPVAKKVLSQMNVNATVANLTTDYKSTSDESFCEYSEELGVWHNCQDQALHSVNPRCDPRFWFYAEEIIKQNRADFETEYKTQRAALNESVSASPSTDEIVNYLRDQVLDEMEEAHYLKENRLNNVVITGTAADNPVIQTPYTFAYFEAATCQFNCPIPMPWTEWTCHCETANNGGNNPDSIPKCCGSTRKRFRGCKDDACRDSTNCKTAGYQVGGSAPVNEQFADQCDEYVAANGHADTCKNILPWATDYKIVDVASNSWWDDTWLQGADIRKQINNNFVVNNYQGDTDQTGLMNEATAKKVLEETWKSPGCGKSVAESCFDHYFHHNDPGHDAHREFETFIREFPSVDVTGLDSTFEFDKCYKEKVNQAGQPPEQIKMTDLLEMLDSDTQITKADQTFSDEFFGCIMLRLYDGMTFTYTTGEQISISLREALIESREFDMFLKENFYRDLSSTIGLDIPSRISNGMIDYDLVFPGMSSADEEIYTPKGLAKAILDAVWEQSSFGGLKGKNATHPFAPTTGGLFSQPGNPYADYIAEFRCPLTNRIRGESCVNKDGTSACANGATCCYSCPIERTDISGIGSDIVYFAQKLASMPHKRVNGKLASTMPAYPAVRVGNTFPVNFNFADDQNNNTKVTLFDYQVFANDPYYQQNLQNIFGN